MKKALITGVTGQDGSYLAEFLLEKGYEVHGIVRRTSSFNRDRLKNIYHNLRERNKNFYLHYGDMTDSSSIIRILSLVKPDEIYNLAAQSHVRVSFEIPEYTANSDALGVLRILEAIKQLGLKNTKFYQASTSELYGLAQETPQKETTPFYPRSPYAVAKLYAYWIVVNYREAYDMFACNGILFNHECVSENTVIIVREKGVISIKRVKDIRKPKQKGNKIQQWILKDLEVWDGNNFVLLNCITATKRNKDNTDFLCKTINTRLGVVEVTNHHNMVDEKNKKIKTRNIKISSRLLHEKLPTQKKISAFSKEEAQFLGMMVADGWIGKDGKANFANNDKELMAEFENLWRNIGLGTICHKTYKTEYGTSTRASLNGGSTYLRYVQNQLYTDDGFKKVPDRILNASKEIQLSFLNGYNKCDGLKSNPCTYTFKNFKTNSPILAQGLLFLIRQITGQEFNLTFDPDKKYYGYYSINLLSPTDNLLKEQKVKGLLKKGMSQREISRKIGVSRTFIRKIQKGGHAETTHHLSKPKNEVKKIICHKNQPEWVFDIETQSGKFMAGVGTIVVSNSPRRGENFVTRKITLGVAGIKLGSKDKIYLGNLNAKRDWGHAKDFVEAMWLMLQQGKPDDFVIATGETHSVKEFIELAFKRVNINIKWEGEGVNEKGIDKETGKVLVEVDPIYFRPTEAESLLGDASKAKAKLGWESKIKFEELVNLMVDHDLKELSKK